MAGSEQSTSFMNSPKFAMGVTAVSGIVQSFIGSYYRSAVRKTNAKWATIVAQEQQKMAELAAQDAIRQSQVKIGEISRKASQVKSGQRVAMAANGVALSSDTVAEVLTTTDVYKQESIAIEEQNGIRSAWGYRMQGLNAVNQASSLMANTSSPFLAGLAGAANSASSALMTYGQYKALGFFK